MITRKNSVWVGLLLGAIALGAFFNSQPFGNGVGFRTSDIEHASMLEGEDFENPIEIPARIEESHRRSAAKKWMLTGECLDQVSMQPVNAAIFMGSKFLAHTGRLGSFRLENLRDGELTFKATGYVDSSVASNSRSSGFAVVKLKPATDGIVVFLRDGVPESNVEAWIATESNLQDSEYERKLHVSDKEGQVRIPMIGDQTIYYSSALGDDGWVRARSGSEVEVSLGGLSRRIVLLDQDGSPLAGKSVKVRWGTSLYRGGIDLRTNQQGVSPIPQYRGPLRIEFDSISMEILEATDSGSKVEFSRYRKTQEWVVTSRTGAGEIKLTCSEPRGIRIVDFESGEPISAQGVWGVEHPGYMKPDSWRGLQEDGHRVEARNGVAWFPRQSFDLKASELAEANRVTVWFEGYEAWHSAAGSSLLAIEEIRLRKRARRSLRVLDGDGRVFGGYLRIWDTSLGIYLRSGNESSDDPNEVYHHTVGRNGLIENMPWSGGGWRVEGLDSTLFGEISETELTGNSVVEVRCGFSTGVVEITGVPENAHAPIVSFLRPSMSTGRSQRVGARQTEVPGVWRAEGLIPGAYMVGPADRSLWYRTLGRQKDSVFPSTVIKSGETVTVRWKKNWSAESIIDGRVTVRGGSRATIRLLGLFGALGERRGVDALKVDIPMDRNGYYSIEKGGYPPRAILVATEVVGRRSGHTRLIPLAVIEPGDDIEVDGTPLRLWSSSEALNQTGIIVRVPVPESLQQYVVDKEVGVFWPPGGDLLVPFVASQFVESVRLRGRWMSEVIPLNSDNLTDRGYEMSEFAIPPSK